MNLINCKVNIIVIGTNGITERPAFSNFYQHKNQNYMYIPFYEPDYTHIGDFGGEGFST